MKILRVLLILPGLAIGVWGLVLLVQFVFPLGPQSISTGEWLIGGTIGHDAVFAPAVGLLGLLVSRLLPRTWSIPLTIGGALSGVLLIIAIPLLWEPYGAPVNPGLHDSDTAYKLKITLIIVWAAVLLAALRRTFLAKAAKKRASVAAQKAAAKTQAEAEDIPAP